MFTLLQLFIGVQLDLLFGEPRRFHPLVGFGKLASYLDGAFTQTSPFRNRFTGLFALLLLVIPPTLFSWWLCEIESIGIFMSMLCLYLCLGGKSLIEHAHKVFDKLRQDDLTAARQAVGHMVSRDTSQMNEAQVSLACVESVLENGNDAIFATIFWFALLGAPGAVCFRLVNTLDAMWGYRTTTYLKFGWAAARLDDLLNLIPARLCALSYAMVGNTKQGLLSWRQQASAWDSPNAGPVMATGAGALNLTLGGVGVYHGQRIERPTLGKGPAPQAADIKRATRLVQFACLLWILTIAALTFVVVYFSGGLIA